MFVVEAQAFLAQESARKPSALLSQLSNQWAFRAASTMLGLGSSDPSAACGDGGASSGAGAGAGAGGHAKAAAKTYPVVSGDLVGLFLSADHTSAATRSRAARAVDVPLHELTKLLSQL